MPCRDCDLGGCYQQALPSAKAAAAADVDSETLYNSLLKAVRVNSCHAGAATWSHCEWDLPPSWSVAQAAGNCKLLQNS